MAVTRTATKRATNMAHRDQSHSRLLVWEANGRHWVSGYVGFHLTADEIDEIAGHYSLARPVWPPEAAELALIRGSHG
jgi:hypothetical protein